MNRRRFKLPCLAMVVVLSIVPPVGASAQQDSTDEQQERTGEVSQSGAAQSAPKQRILPQGFHVVLLLGDLQGGTTQDNLPNAARKALADLKDFLPYKSYRVLDSAWTQSTSRVVNRLRGLEEEHYELNLIAQLGFNDKLNIRFELGEAGSHETPMAREEEAIAARERQEQARGLEHELAELERSRDQLRQKLSEKHPEVQKREAQLREARRHLEEYGLARSRMRGSGKIIDTSFTMDVGETVVVGTSRLKGDKALIVLLSAVPRTTGR